MDDSRTVATVVLLGIGLWIVGRVARPIGWWRVGLVLAMAAGAVLAFTLEVGRVIYGLELLDPGEWIESAAITLVAVVVLEIALQISVRLVLARQQVAQRSLHLANGESGH
jgi:cation-transporting ATPase E